MNLLKALPMGIVMVAGPQIVTAIMLATSRDAKRASAAFLAGVALATTLGLTAFYVLARVVGGTDPADDSGGNDALHVLTIALLLVLAFLAFKNRHKTDPPGWMVKLQEATPRFAFRVGFILFIAMPTDVITMWSVSRFLARNGEPWRTTLGFMALTVLLAGIPFLLLLAMGRRAETLLPRMRTWITSNAWIVNEIVIVFFLSMSLGS